MCLDAQFICQNLLDLQMESADSYSPCVVDIEIEVETVAKPKSGDIIAQSTKNGERIETFLDVLFYCKCYLLYPQLDLASYSRD